MKLRIQGHSDGEIRRYRQLKLMLAVAMIPLVYSHLARREVVLLREEHLVPQPIVTNDDALRGDFPLWWRGGRGPLRKIGSHEVVGRGPVNADVALYDENAVIGRTKTDRRGSWSTKVTIEKPGLRTYRADFQRGGIAMGHSRNLPATILDPKAVNETGLRISNLAPRDRVIAGRFTLRGSAPPGDFVQIYIDATFLGRAEVDLAGRWSFKPRVRDGGRRTFTIVDEITTRQFGPLPLIIVGRTPPGKKASGKKVSGQVGKLKNGTPTKATPPTRAPTIRVAAKKPARPVGKKPLLPRKATPKPRGKARSPIPLR